MKGMKEEMNDSISGIQTSIRRMEKNIASLTAATPGAASIPQVYVAGCKDKALKKGSDSTWTIVRASKSEVYLDPPATQTVGAQESRTPSKSTTQAIPVTPEREQSEVEEYTYFAVSSAHCIREIIDCTKPCSSQEGGVVNRSAIFLSDDIQSLLCSNDESGDDSASKVRVVRVGFHKGCETDKAMKAEHDIVFLELDGKPSFNIEDIPIVGNVAALPANINGNVAGTALSGRVNGHGLVTVGSNHFSFVANFLESGCSGTVMFLSLLDGGMLPIGIFKGTASVTQSGMRNRGAIVGFPKWTDVEWTKCAVQVRSIEVSTLRLGVDGDNVVRDTFKRRKWYLTLDRRGSYDFVEKIGGNSSENHVCDSDFE